MIAVASQVIIDRSISPSAATWMSVAGRCLVTS